MTNLLIFSENNYENSLIPPKTLMFDRANDKIHTTAAI